jgi:hypothetical protein
MNGAEWRAVCFISQVFVSDPDFSTVALNCSHDIVLHPVRWEGKVVMLCEGYCAWLWQRASMRMHYFLAVLEDHSFSVPTNK